ncbi:MAG: hypothetical protein ACR2QF_07815 [Geminicoccaceae bacterium]
MSHFAAIALPIAIGLQGVSAVAGARSEQQQATSQAAALEFNADTERQRQSQFREAGNEQERQQRRLSRLAIGRNKAAIGGSGLALEGQRLDLLKQDVLQAELDSLQIRENTDREVEASQQQEAIDRFQARQTRRQGSVNARTTLLSGVAGAANTLIGAR